MLSLKSVPSAVTCKAGRHASPTFLSAVPKAAVRVTPREREVDTLLQKAIEEAQACEATDKNCTLEWEVVEEISAAKSHMKDAKRDDIYQDPLEAYCREAPDAEECRVYED